MVDALGVVAQGLLGQDPPAADQGVATTTTSTGSSTEIEREYPRVAV
jgi:hypothetical protein